MDELPGEPEVRGIARRRLLGMAGGAALALGTGGLLAGCNSKKDDGNGNSVVPFNGDGGAKSGNNGGGNSGGDDSGGGGAGGSGGDDGGGSGGGVGGSGDGGDEDYRSHQGVGTAWSGLTG